MKRSVQKWMAVILSCCICLSIWSAAALAAGTGEFDPVGNPLPNPGMEEGAALWWMRPKKSFTDEHDKNLPKYLYLPPEHLMLLK
mgnify:CR=1 FL=1